jgi:RND superfamily putative drug exporter
MLAATLSGRLDPVSGRAQVGGHPLPSEGANVAAIVALEDIGGTDRAEVRVGIAELLVERLRLTQPWYRAFSVHRRARTWIDRVDAVLGAGHAIAARSTIDQLPQLERAVALTAVALAEHTPVVMLDLFDNFADRADVARFLVALDCLAPATTTIVLGAPGQAEPTPIPSLRREVEFLNLDELAASTRDRKEALQ